MSEGNSEIEIMAFSGEKKDLDLVIEWCKKYKIGHSVGNQVIVLKCSRKIKPITDKVKNYLESFGHLKYNEELPESDSLGQYVAGEFIDKALTYKYTKFLRNFINEQSTEWEKDRPVIDPLAAQVFSQDHLALAENFVSRQPLYYDRNLLWWVWDIHNLVWRRVDEIEIMNNLDSVAKLRESTTSGGVRSSIIEALRRKARLFQPQEPPESWVQFDKEIIDVSTGEVHNPSPKVFMRNAIPWKLGAGQDTPTIDRLFRSWVAENDVMTLYEILAFCLYRKYFIHRVFAFVGNGRNGKSTYLNLIKRFLGQDNFVTADLKLLLDSRFESASLYLKLACLMGECSDSMLTRTDYLKRLSGGDETRIEFKGKQPFGHTNYAKLIMSMNQIPLTADRTLGFYSRWLIINFNQNTFKEEKEVLSEIPDAEMENLARKCLNLLQGLLVRGRFRDEGDFTAREKKYEELSNPVGQFIKECCESDVNSEIPIGELYQHLSVWMEKNHHRPMSKDQMSKTLGKLNYEKKLIRIDEKPVRCLLNFKFVTAVSTITPFSTQNAYRDLSEKQYKSCNTRNTDDKNKTIHEAVEEYEPSFETHHKCVACGSDPTAYNQRTDNYFCPKHWPTSKIQTDN